MVAPLRRRDTRSNLDQSDGVSDSASTLLSVTSSVRGLRWVDRLPSTSAAAAAAIAQRHGLPDMLGRFLAARQVQLEDVDLFLNPTIKALMPDPSTLQDMDRAAKRLAAAIEKPTKIAIFGDYDVDGACSAALWANYLHHHNVDTLIHIPDRMLEGYGPNIDALDQLVDDGAGLIVTVDCGTTSSDVLGQLKKRSVDCIVIDHHQADEVLPDVHAIINPNRQDDLSGQGHLCAAGVVFLVLAAVTRELRNLNYYENSAIAPPDLLEMLDLVALATVADVVPLTGLNRAYVSKGLQVMQARKNVGLRALSDASGLSGPPTPYHLGFILGPRINAGGRIGNAALGAKLLSETDETKAAKVAAQLDKLNRERKDVESAVLEAAIAAAERELESAPDSPIIVVSGEEWHKGVVGLVASRLVERFGRPACVIAWEPGGNDQSAIGTGSLRSIAGVDIGSAVRRAVEAGLLVKGGGHAMAAGLTVAREKIDELTSFLTEDVRAAQNGERPPPELLLDGALMPSGATAQLVDGLEHAGPFGQGNPQPCFAFPMVGVRFAKIVGGAHVRCSLQSSDGGRIEAIAFRAADQPLGDLLLSSAGLPIHVAGQLRRDSWGGREKIELQIVDAAKPVART